MNRRMTTESFARRAVQLGIAAVLLSLPTGSPSALGAGFLRRAQGLGEAASLLGQDQKTQAQLDKEQEKRDREQEMRDREQEKKEAEQERLDRLQELYDDGREALDDGQYSTAEKKFAELSQMKGPQTDAALYWLAYADNKQGKRDTALSTIAELKKSYPQSRWNKDAAALEIEVRQSSGAKTNPDSVGNEDLKLLALQGLMNGDPEKAVPLVEKVLDGSSSPTVKSKALFVLAQSGSPQAMQILGKVALGQSNPELQRKAVEYLGIFGGERAEKTLAEVYTSTSDVSIKHAVLKSYMISGNRNSLFNAAKNEKSDDLKRDAIKQLGLVGGESELEQLYRTENSSEVRREILQSFFLAGDVKRLVEAAEGEKDPELRRAAIRNLGLVGKGDASNALQTIYAKESDRSLREEVLNAYFLEGNSAALVAIAKSEKDPDLRKKAVEKLSLIGDKTSTDYMMEILQK
jgi:HEAT repeat protein